jgi:hypothetical protein
MKIFLFCAVAFLAGCSGVRAAGPTTVGSSPTVITSPTLLTSEQFGDFQVKGGSLFGNPSPTGQGVKIHGTVTVTGSALLQDLFIDGCILVDHANRVELERVWVQGCAGDGIAFVSDSDLRQACCGKLDHVVSINNGGAGLHTVNTADVFISMSEFENNADCGVRLENSPTVRIIQSDFGGNTVCGLWADPASHKTMLANNQFGNNTGDDLVLQSQNNLVNNQEFIGPLVAGVCSIRSSGSQLFGANFYGPRPVCQGPPPR